jgi:putative transposase
MRPTPEPCHGFRFPAELIAHAVWLSHGFRLSRRAAETIPARRGPGRDLPVRSRRSAQAAKRFVPKLPKGPRHVPRVIVPDKLRSCGAAEREVPPGVEHRRSRYLDDRAGVSPQPRRRRERRAPRFTSPRPGRRFLAGRARSPDPFQLRRHLLTANDHRAGRGRAFPTWRAAAGVALAA